jgi:cytochrome d ubiquinol oxidase subunit I
MKGRHKEQARLVLKTALIVFISTSLIQLFIGHAHSIQVTETQPEKMAAFEALWETQEGAPFSIFGIPDEKAQKTRLNIKIPKFLSFLIHFDANAEVKGLDAFPEEERPPVLLPFMAYHIMIGFGGIFILLSLIGIYLLIRKKLWASRWYLKLLLWAIPLAYLSNEFGWIAAEVGRQPWVVYKVLRTSDAVSKVVPAGQILFTLILFIVVYTLIGIIGGKIILKTIKKGPDVLESPTKGGE